MNDTIKLIGVVGSFILLIGLLVLVYFEKIDGAPVMTLITTIVSGIVAAVGLSASANWGERKGIQSLNEQNKKT